MNEIKIENIAKREVMKDIHDTTLKLKFNPNQCKMDGNHFHKTFHTIMH